MNENLQTLLNQLPPSATYGEDGYKIEDIGNGRKKLSFCSFCSNYNENVSKELIAQINLLADQAGFMVSHGICNNCKKIILDENDMKKDSEYINLNNINVESKTRLRRRWMETDDPFYHAEPEEDAFAERVDEWVYELRADLNENFPGIKIVNSLIESFDEYDRKSGYQDIESPYDYLQHYFADVSNAILDIQTDPFGPGNEDDRIILKKKIFTNSPRDDAEIQLLEEYEEFLESFLDEMPISAKEPVPYDPREDAEDDFEDNEEKYEL